MREREQWTAGHRSEVKTAMGFVVLLLGSSMLYFGSGTLVQGSGSGMTVFGLMQSFPRSQTWMLPMISNLLRRLRLPWLSEPIQDQPKSEAEV